MTYNHYTLLGLQPSFNIDLKDLEERYFRLQQQFHPDRLIHRPAAEKVRALQVATDINAAYQALKDPLARATYLLSLQNIHIGSEKDAVKPSQELLIQAMEDREHLMQASSADEIETLAYNNQRTIEATIRDLDKSFGEKAFHKAAELAMKLKYLQKFADEIRLRKQKI